MSIQRRLSLLMLLVSIGTVVCALAIGWSQLRKSSRIHQERSRAENEAAARVITLHGEPLIAYTADYTRWDEMVRLTQTCDTAWATANIAATYATFRADAAWVFRADGRPLLCDRSPH